MLTDHERTKIKAEEIFRDEIRKSLAEKKPKTNKAVAFLNSALGLWFLSTIVLGLFTYLFNEYRENKKAVTERETKIRQLDLEIESRISQFWVHLESLIKRDEQNHIDSNYALKEGVAYDTIRVFWAAFKNPPSFNSKMTTTIYKEYEERTTISLMIELVAQLEQKYDLKNGHPVGIDPELRFSKEEIQQRTEISKIDGAATFIGGNGIFYERQPTIRQIWNAFNEKIIVKRWDKKFPYTDCLFC